jgi:CubicO group peptidase (beta-lactamase class C family)
MILQLGFFLVWSIVSGPDIVYYALRRCCDSRIDDFDHYPGRRLQASDVPFHFGLRLEKAGLPELVEYADGRRAPLDELLESSDSVAFLVIKDDEIRYERYFQGYDASSLSKAFSVSKSVFSVLFGMAVDDQLIRSTQQAVTDYVPELAGTGFEAVSLEDLLQMRSGAAYSDKLNPLGIHVTFTFTSDLEAAILDMRTSGPAGGSFSYKSGNTALLGLVLSRALGRKSITDYAQERLWTPLGMESDGVWNLDHQGAGLERTWCCLAATARDFAKIGRLFLNGGRWGEQQHLSRSWIERSTTGAFLGDDWPQTPQTRGFSNYGYQWWLPEGGRGDFLASGKDGQFIYVAPAREFLIVRLGWSYGKIRGKKMTDERWLRVFHSLADQIE